MTITNNANSAKTNPGIPPLAGLATYAEASRVGLGVDENVQRMRRLNYVEARLYEISAAFMNPTPEWEVKGALSLHLYLDGEHSQALRARVAELRRPPLYLDEAPDDALEALMNEAIRARNTVELLAGVFGILRPALLAAYQEHLADVNPLFDFPTVRLMRQAVAEEEQMVGWGEQALAAITQAEEDQAVAVAWQEHLRVYLAAAAASQGAMRPPQASHCPHRAPWGSSCRKWTLSGTCARVTSTISIIGPTTSTRTPWRVGTSATWP